MFVFGRLTRAHNPDGTNESQATRWQLVTFFDIVTEVLLLVLPVHLVWNLQMPTAKKAMIIIAFWIRLP